MLRLFLGIQNHCNHWISDLNLGQLSVALLPSAGLCWPLWKVLPPLFSQHLHQWSFNIKINRLSGLMVLDSTRHWLAAEVGREKSCLPGWTEGHCRHPDLLRLPLSHLRGQRWWWCPHCRGVWCHHRSRPPPSPPPGHADTNVWSLVHTNFQKEIVRGWRSYLAFGGGFAANCDLLQGVTVAEVFHWRQQSWDGFSARGDRVLGIPLFSSSGCL